MTAICKLIASKNNGYLFFWSISANNRTMRIKEKVSIYFFFKGLELTLGDVLKSLASASLPANK